jgi:hypothetical protein
VQPGEGTCSPPASSPGRTLASSMLQCDGGALHYLLGHLDVSPWAIDASHKSFFPLVCWYSVHAIVRLLHLSVVLQRRVQATGVGGWKLAHQPQRGPRHWPVESKALGFMDASMEHIWCSFCCDEPVIPAAYVWMCGTAVDGAELF